MEFIKKFHFFFLFMICIACGGQGTEVNNPVSPDEIVPIKKKFEAEVYSVTLDILEDWDYTEYDLMGYVTDENAFTDPAGTSRTLAHFTKPNLGYFTVFEAFFKEDQTLFDFLRARRPDGEFETFETPASETRTLTWIYFSQTEPGPRGGFLFDLYATDNREGVLWMRTELLGTSQERQKTWEEFWHMVGTAEIHKGVSHENNQ